MTTTGGAGGTGGGGGGDRRRELEELREAERLERSSLESLQQRVKEAKTLLTVYEDTADTQEGAMARDIQKVEVLQRQKRLIEAAAKDHKALEKLIGEQTAEGVRYGDSVEEVLATLQKLAIENEKNLAITKNNVKWADKWTVSMEESLSAASDLGKSLGKSMQVYNKGFDIAKFDGLRKAMMGGTASMKEFGKQALLSIGATLINNIVNLAIALHDTEAAFMKATGANGDMARQMTGTYEETRKFGVTMEEASATHQALYKTFTDFTMATEAEQKALGKTGAVLARYGVSAESFAKGIQNSTKMLGMSKMEAEETSRELVTYAKALGVAPDMLADKYASMGPQLAKFGNQGKKAFKDLAHISKITGMEMEKILNITNKFDTFEGAADQAGKLNAALGGNFVNAMDLMMATDPAERFGMIRDSILDAGLSFDDMSYYQKKFYTESLGLADEGELAMMLAGNMDNLAGATNKTTKDYETMAKEAADLQSLQDKFNATMAELVPVLEPIIDGMATLLTWLSDNTFALKAILYVVVALSVAMTVFGIAMAVAAAPAIAATAAVWAFYAVVAALLAMLFIDTVASTFLEGLIKVANAFKDIAVAVLETINPFNQIVKVVDAFGRLISGVLSGVTGLFTVLTSPEAASNIMKIGKAITDIPLRKNIEFAASMGAAATAATAAAFGGGGGGGGGGGATQTVRQPIRLEIGGKPMADFVLEVVGKEIRSINMGT